jgi:hypothetical protein
MYCSALVALQDLRSPQIGSSPPCAPSDASMRSHPVLSGSLEAAAAASSSGADTGPGAGRRG